jgi:hypothetical protein
MSVILLFISRTLVLPLGSCELLLPWLLNLDSEARNFTFCLLFVTLALLKELWMCNENCEEMWLGLRKFSWFYLSRRSVGGISER